MKKFLAVLICVILVGMTAWCESPRSESTNEATPMWYSYGLGSKIPDPASVIGRSSERIDMYMNTDNAFLEDFGEVTESEFGAYIDLLIDCGFNQDVTRMNDTFRGSSEDGITITAMIYAGSLEVRATYLK